MDGIPQSASYISTLAVHDIFLRGGGEMGVGESEIDERSITSRPFMRKSQTLNPTYPRLSMNTY